ncbi:chromate transporter [Paenibacillus antarcticus]|uniref:Chromate transporter n=1 Tax=Paenibacillus antarcticus TaxID=253703 RepID=A0A168QLK9_9BACL|nr:chromate transporter [Paenibacillus antarcticus]OAB47928.1 chromate transporter [Paenibacillus antarcticus]
MIWDLFVTFIKVGLLSFGGGYAIIPMIQHEAITGGWLSEAIFQEVVSIAGMAPGPVATNSATLIGYRVAGIEGAIASTLGMVLPSFVLIILISVFFYQVRNSQWIKASFYGLRPVITGLIAYAAIHFGFMGKDQSFISWQTPITLIIVFAALYSLVKYKLHPLTVIIASGILGIALF